MKWGLSVIALALVSTGTARGLDADARRKAEEYLTILKKNPVGSPVVDPLWSLYDHANDEDELLAWCRKNATAFPVASARLLVRAGQKAEALTILRAAAPDSPAAAETLAEVLESEDDLPGAMAAVKMALNQEKSPERFFRLGELAERAGETSQARQAWEQAAQLAPHDAGLGKKLAAAYAGTGDFAAASAQAHALTVPADRMTAWGDISRKLEARGDFSKAITAQENLLDLLGPGHWNRPEAEHHLLALHAQAGTLETLRDRWQRESEDRPQDAEAALRMVRLEEYSGNAPDALAWLQKAGQRQPRDAGLAMKSARLALSQGALEVAVTATDRALSLRPEETDAIFLRAELAALQGDPAGAEKRIATYLEKNPDDQDALDRSETFYRRMRLTGPLERQLQENFSAHLDNVAAATNLANFYLETHRFPEAAATLARFDSRALPPTESAAIDLQFSVLLREAGLRKEALTWARQAWAATPDHEETALILAELLQANGEDEAARETLEAACAAAPGLPREDLDRRVFLARQEADANRQNEADDIFPRPDVLVQELVTQLGEAARAKTGKEKDWLRWARWLGWQDDRPRAVAALREGLRKDSPSPTLRRALVEALALAGQTDQALTELQTLISEQPEKEHELRRRLGELQLTDENRIEEGLATFADLVEADPENWQARSDLALAEQRVGNWFRALETWKEAWMRAPSEARPRVLPSLLNAATRLQLREKALDFLAEAIGSETQPGVRDELLREAARYASRNGGSAYWQAHLEARIKAAPQEIFWRLGRAWLWQEDGRPEEARDSLTGTGGGESTAAAMLAAAEAAGNWKEAARLLEQKISRSRTDDPSTAITHAEYLQRAGEWEQAQAAWDFVARRYARDPGALTSAAEYFVRIGDGKRGEVLDRAAAKLDGCAPQVSFRLGERALERGDRTQALADFEMVLARTTPDSFAAREYFPLPEWIRRSPAPTMASVSFLPGGTRTGVRAPEPWPQVTASEAEGCRLLAIEHLGHLLVNRPNKDQWIEQFSQPRERIWAAYAAGEIDRALDEMETLTLEKNTPRAVGQIFAALALVEGTPQTHRLARWATENSDETEPGATRWNQVGEAFVRLMRAGWDPAPSLGEEVFRSAPALERWQVARTLATLHRYRTAVLLGETVPEDLSPAQAEAAWWEISRWWLALRDPEQALDRLDRALAVAPPAIGYDNIFFSVLRARWLLTRPEDRPKFVQSVSSLWHQTQLPAAEASARALLAALEGKTKEADRQLKEVFARREEIGGWDRAQQIQRGGARLEEWKLPRLARELYRLDLASDSVLAAMQGVNFRSATESLLITNQLANAHVRSLPYLINEWIARGVSAEDLLQTAVRLQSSSPNDASRRVFAQLTARNPRNLQVVIGILNLALTPDYAEIARPFLAGLLAEENGTLPPTLRQGAVLRLAGLEERAGNRQAALKLLEQATAIRPSLTGITPPRVQLLLNEGRFQDALDVLKNTLTDSSPPEPGLLRPLVELLVGFGRTDEARAWVEKSSTFSPAERVGAEIHLKELFTTPSPSSLPVPVRSETEWTQLREALDQSTEEPETRFAAGRQFLLSYRDLPETMRQEELRRLEILARRETSLQPSYFLLRKELADSPAKIDALTESMRSEWNGGRGSYLAGEIFLQLLLPQDPSGELEAVLAEYLTGAHFNETAWDQIGCQLLQSGRPRLAARVFSALLTRRPGSPGRALLLAEALGKSDRLAVAREIVAPIRRIAALEPERHLDLARYDLAMGDLDRARQELVAAQPYFFGQPQWAELWGRLAQDDLAANRTDEACEAILRAMTNPSFQVARLITDYHDARGELVTLTPQSNVFGLAPEVLEDWKIEMAQRLLDRGETKRAWVWIEAGAHPGSDPRQRNLLRQLAATDPTRAERFWERALQHPSRDLQVEVAQFYLQRAEQTSDPATALRALTRAQTLHPGSFAIARAYAEKLLQQGDPSRARQVLRELLASYALPADRRAATEMLARLEASPALPRGG